MPSDKLRCLRKILGLNTTYVDRSNTNKDVSRKLTCTTTLKTSPKRTSRLFNNTFRQEALLKHTVRAEEGDPSKLSTFEPNALIPHLITTRKVGRPRVHWTDETYKRLHIKHGGSLAEWRENKWNCMHNLREPILNRLISTESLIAFFRELQRM